MLVYQCGGYATKHKHDSSKYYVDRRITSKKTDKDDGYCRRIDQSTPPFIYSDNETASLLGTIKGIQKTSMEISESTREFSCPICLVSYHGYSIFKCEKCDQPFCERCKWSVYTCGRCGYDLTDSACRDYHREKVVRSASRTFVENPCETFVKPFVPSF